MVALVVFIIFKLQKIEFKYFKKIAMRVMQQINIGMLKKKHKINMFLNFKKSRTYVMNKMLNCLEKDIKNRNFNFEIFELKT